MGLKYQQKKMGKSVGMIFIHEKKTDIVILTHEELTEFFVGEALSS